MHGEGSMGRAGHWRPTPSPELGTRLGCRLGLLSEERATKLPRLRRREPRLREDLHHFIRNPRLLRRERRHGPGPSSSGRGRLAWNPRARPRYLRPRACASRAPARAATGTVPSSTPMAYRGSVVQPGASSILEAHPRADSVSTPREHGSCDAGRSTGLGTTTSPLVRLACAYTSSRGRSRSRGCAGCGFAGAVSVRCVERSAGPVLAPDQPEPAPAKPPERTRTRDLPINPAPGSLRPMSTGPSSRITPSRRRAPRTGRRIRR